CGRFPFAARVAPAAACWSAFLARLSNFRRCLPEVEAAWSMRPVAWVSFRVTFAGIVWLMHAGLSGNAASVHRALGDGSVVIVLLLVPRIVVVVVLSPPTVVLVVVVLPPSIVEVVVESSPPMVVVVVLPLSTIVVVVSVPPGGVTVMRNDFSAPNCGLPS